MKRLHLLLDEHLGKCGKTDTEISEALAASFDAFEQEWLDIARPSFKGGFPKAGYVGSCALVSIVHNNKLYVANAGDSKAALMRLTPDGSGYERHKVSKTFNANKSYE